MAGNPYQCLNCGSFASEDEYKGGTCRICQSPFEYSEREIRDGMVGDLKLMSELGQKPEAEVIGPSYKLPEKIGGGGLAEVFVVLGWLSVGIGAFLLLVAIVTGQWSIILPAIIGIDAGLLTAILGVVARAVVANANLNREILQTMRQELLGDLSGTPKEKANNLMPDTDRNATSK